MINILLLLLFQAVPLTPAINLKPVTASANPAGMLRTSNLEGLVSLEKGFKETQRLAPIV
jgi:hypothetical protein